MHQHFAVPIFIKPCVIENSIAFAPKYRRQVIYRKIKAEIGRILRELCERKGVEIIEAECCPDHIHMLVRIPPSLKEYTDPFTGEQAKKANKKAA